MRRTPEELHKLAENEKEQAIHLLNRLFGIDLAFEDNLIREAVECIIKATMLYNSEIHADALKDLNEKMKGDKK